jgi:molecular chaperone DnaK (HSP70)
MNEGGRVLIFADAGQAAPVLMGALQNSGLTPLWPWESHDDSIVRLIVVDRPAPVAVKICANLRSQKSQLASLPILVLLDSLGEPQKAQLTVSGVDIVFKPIKAQALQRYIASKAAIPAPEPPAHRNARTEQPTGSGSAQMDRGRSEKAEPGKEQAQVFPLDVRPEPAAQTPGIPSIHEPAGHQLEVAPHPPVLEDVIPESGSLLRVESLALEVSRGGVLCAACRNWVCRREDAFCARCGEALVVLVLPVGASVFEPLGNHRVAQLVELRNAGLNPVQMSFKVYAGAQIEKRFALHAASSVLDGGGAANLLITFDARGLDLNTAYRAELEILTNERGFLSRRLELRIERLAKPQVSVEESYSYVLGFENEWTIRLRNEGGGTLVLTRISLDEAVLGPFESVRAKGGETAVVRLQVPDLELPLGSHTKRMLFEFEHSDPVVRDVLVLVIRPPRMAVQPGALDFGVVSTGRNKRAALALINAGGEDLLVDSIVPSARWVKCIAEAPLRLTQGMSLMIDVEVRGARELAGDQVCEITLSSNSYSSSTLVIGCRVKFVEPQPYEEYLGIDFGTTASCVAVLDNRSKQPVVIELDDRSDESSSDARIMPSVLYFHSDGSVLAGREALQEATIQPANAVTSIKRALGLGRRKVFAGREYDATELASKIIQELVARTEDRLFQLGEYKTPQRAILTVPIEFRDNQRRALLEACTLTGLEIQAHSSTGIIIDEAQAAALYYLSKRVEQTGEVARERLMIFDFGGGTLDCALIEIAADEKISFRTLALGGDQHLGGEDVDWVLVDLFAQRAKLEFTAFDDECLGDEKTLAHRFPSAEMAQAAHSTRASFKRQAELAKISLGAADEVEVVIGPLLRKGATPLDPYIKAESSPVQLQTRLRRDEFEEAIRPIVERAVSVAEAACHRAGAEPSSVSAVLHVGRTSLIPMVREGVKRLLPAAEDRSELVEPKLCVALGAAYWGFIKDRPGANIEFSGVGNQLTHDIGYLDVKSMKKVFVPIFAARSEFPCEKTVELPGRELIDLRLAENLGMSLNGKGNYHAIGSCRISSGRDGGECVAVHFAINENRMLEITAHDRRQEIIGLVEE